MARSKKWLAALAAGGSTVGAVAALSSVPSAASPTKLSATAPAAAKHDGERDQLAQAVAQVNQLQTKIAALRHQLLADEKLPVPSGGTQVLIERASGSSVSGGGNSGALASWQAQLQAEQQQLAQEQAALQSEKAALDSDAAKLQQEQQQVAEEQKQVSSATTSPPTTHTTTGASGTTSSTTGTDD